MTDREIHVYEHQRINVAAAQARPGDTVIVHAGIYREWVSPSIGGESDARRISFLAAEGEHVVICGSEAVPDWTACGNDIWRKRLDDNLFSDGHPFRDRLGGDWFHDKGRIHHTGDVYCDGVSLYEVTSLDAVTDPQPQPDATEPDASLRCWCVEEHEDHVIIFANFGGRDPNNHLIEVSVRPAVFFPRQTGVNYITVSGFELRHAATPWAPPTAQQMGLIGPHWAKGWVIENNHIHHARCSGISLGKDAPGGQNLWTERRVKHGTQREREIVFDALNRGWSRDTVGSHVVRRNHIHDCEQTGICGHLGAIFSEITDNHIHDIHVKRQFKGAEIAGIKLHAAIDTLIARNHIHHAGRGIWLDWQAQGARVHANLLHSHDWEDFFIEVTHGPCTFDHNILLSPVAFRNEAQGTTFAHNLIVGINRQQGVPNRFTFYHVPHSTAVAGLMTVLGGDDRWYNNLFLPAAGATEIPTVDDRNTDFSDTMASRRGYGTAIYDGFPVGEEQWQTAHSPDDYARLRLPVFIGHNGYGAGALPYEHETGAVRGCGYVRLLEEDGRSVLEIELDQTLAAAQGRPVTTANLGQAFQPEAPYRGHDGSPLSLNRDYHGAPHSGGIGPFAQLQAGSQRIDPGHTR